MTSFIQRKKGRSRGRISVRHKGGGSKKLYREVIFNQEKKGVPGVVKTIEYDPFRTAFIALISYEDGSWRYILSPSNLRIGDEIICDENAPLKDGNRMMLKNIPIGAQIHNIEIRPQQGGKMIKSAGSFVMVLAQDGNYTHFKMPSGEIRKVPSACYASIGQLSNAEHSLVKIGKAGRMRLMGIRPTVRGKAMNPVDHPYGGGEGRTKRGTKRPKDVYGKVTGGRKTRRRKKYSNKFIIKRRKGKRK